MPAKEAVAIPDSSLTPLDRALDAIQNQEPPLDVTQPAEEPEPVPEPQALEEPEEEIAEEEEKPLSPPVPEARVVEVQPNSSFFGLSVGMYDPFTHSNAATSFNLEWQPGVQVAGFLQPLFGALMTTDGTLMGYGGIGVPFKFGNSKQFMIMPSVAVGAYEEGDGFDLDSTLAFRVGAELAYIFEDKSRIGINTHVLTNGRSFGRDDRTEVIGLAYTTPLDALIKGGRPSPEARGTTEEVQP